MGFPRAYRALMKGDPSVRRVFERRSQLSEETRLQYVAA